MCKLKKHLIPLLCIIALVIFNHYQLIGDINTHFIGRPFEDALEVLWRFWWLDHTLTQGKSLLFTEDVYFPNGYYLGVDPQPPWSILPYVPLIRLAGPLVAYNLALLGTLVIGGFGTYLLVESITNNRLAGIVATPVYILSPIITLRLGGHLNVLLGMQWLPYIMFFARRGLITTDKSRWLASAIAGMLYGLAAISCWYFIFVGFLPIISIFIIAYLQKLKGWPQSAAVLLLVTMLTTAPFVILTVKARSLTFGDTTGFNLADSDQYAMGINWLFLPNQLNPLWQTWLADHVVLRGESSAVSLGYGSIILAVIGLVLNQDNAKWGYVVLVLAAITLAMGLTLHWNGRHVELPLTKSLRNIYDATIFHITKDITHKRVIPLPGLILVKIVPFYRMMRAWSRFMIAGMLGMAILVGYGAQAILSQTRAIKGITLILLVFTIIIIEGRTAPYPHFTKASLLHRPVDDWLAAQPSGTAIAEYPRTAQDKPALYSQSIHQQPIVNGIAVHVPYHLKQVAGIQQVWPMQATVETLDQWQVKYLLLTIHPDVKTNTEQLAETLSLKGLQLVEVFPYRYTETRRKVYVFEVK
jgi:hypothetical protein